MFFLSVGSQIKSSIWNLIWLEQRNINTIVAVCKSSSVSSLAVTIIVLMGTCFDFFTNISCCIMGPNDELENERSSRTLSPART